MGSYEVDDLFIGGSFELGSTEVRKALGDRSEDALVRVVKKESRLLQMMKEKVWTSDSEFGELVSLFDY